jgi:hypothetical protein
VRALRPLGLLRRRSAPAGCSEAPESPRAGPREHQGCPAIGRSRPSSRRCRRS